MPSAGGLILSREPSRFTIALRQVHRRLTAFIMSVVALFGAYQLHYHPQTPLPQEWNAALPLDVSAPVSALTGWKLRQALASPDACLAALDQTARYEALTPRNDREECNVPNRVALSDLANVSLSLDETSCATALRTAMWIEHGVQPAARELLGTQVARVVHIGSYNCRRIRTSSGNSTRWSSHATADALDVAGFDLADGRRLRLIRDWSDTDSAGAFLRAAQASSCKWYRTSLGPEYNALHADHFHLQATGWGTCR